MMVAAVMFPLGTAPRRTRRTIYRIVNEQGSPQCVAVFIRFDDRADYEQNFKEAIQSICETAPLRARLITITAPHDADRLDNDRPASNG